MLALHQTQRDVPCSEVHDALGLQGARSIYFGRPTGRSILSDPIRPRPMPTVTVIIYSDIRFLLEFPSVFLCAYVLPVQRTVIMANEKRGGYRQINQALNICAWEGYLNEQHARLPTLEDVEQISPRVLRVLGQNEGKVRRADGYYTCSSRLIEGPQFTLQGTNTYIVGTGRHRLLIDTGQGIPEWASLISSTLAGSSIELSHVLLTHWHGDHTGGVPDLLRMYPDLSDSIYKHTPGKGQKPISDGQTFRVEGATVRAVHTPGHSHDHMCFILEEENAMFTGDNVLGHGSSAVEVLSTWMSSLRMMQSLRCAVGYPAHGAVIRDLPSKLDLELTQKARREDRVVETLKQMKTETQRNGARGKGSVTVQQLVTAMHGHDLDEQVRTMALEPFVDEVLRKLAQDDRVAFEVRGGQKKWFAIEYT
ncbi:metallo-beta-lactamase type thioesterase tpcB [Aspergillus fumigatus Af293]|uniref:Atrochrysone carboxyl ACP thioesterase n=1 Tax=Aspergillus fumigatus (strain ATCC MYA-4609 / CBS 101355 / FGSC A1100 / Af293) TaxID=330879 RepID=TPCB_ASPFU|nr:metallo-beta-lactamase domain protein, putative [Aspergillus fumigatus Af293]Q4WQZ6.1 RecName: Full=Atrochrysone carboxyl ACP thioesterase; Short=ACTE; AltName: Full=Trypacidin synthesis protein B [Aspergillus fumigatus Af293]EAL89338.1 metallo-beta-lactamase domain protein, putative [Aspergillus fumigatus Af293]